jgi:hypothetical protein
MKEWPPSGGHFREKLSPCENTAGKADKAGWRVSLSWANMDDRWTSLLNPQADRARLAVSRLEQSGGLEGLWCKRQDLARYDLGRAAGGVGMSKLMGVEQLFEGRHFDRESSSCACAGIFASS